jgi:triacylglycerol lipase
MSSKRQSLPMYFPPVFSLPYAVLCNELVNTAYDMYYQWQRQGSPPDKQSFHWTPNGPAALTYSAPIWGNTLLSKFLPEPFAFVACAPQNNLYLVVRGSETAADWMDDADIAQKAYSPVPGYGKVHTGFMDIYASMSLAVRAAVNSALQKLGGNAKAFYVTGHSLGSALSTLAVPDVIARSNLDRRTVGLFHYPLASPRVGDPDFYYQYLKQNVPTFRVIDTEDVVPDLPPSVISISILGVTFTYIYKHVGLEVSYTAQYDSDAGNHDHINSYYFALKNPTQPEGPIESQVAEAAASMRLLRLKRENDLLKRLVAEREMVLAATRGKPKRTPPRARKRRR